MLSRPLLPIEAAISRLGDSMFFDHEQILTRLPPLLRMRLVFEVAEPIVPSQAIGAMWRGALGKALRGIDVAAYRRLLAPEPGPGSSIGRDNMPAPFVIDAEMPQDLVALPGDPLTVDVTMIGEAATDAPTLLEAFEAAGHAGLGKGRGQAALVQAGTIWNDHPDGLPEVPRPPVRPRTALVVLRTPWRSGSEPFTRKTFRSGAFAASVLRRVDLLATAYGAGGVNLPVPEPTLSRVQVWPVSQHRWSAKLEIENDLSGTMGTFILKVPDEPSFWNALWYAQWVQFGSKTAFGLGSLRVHPIQ